MWMVNVDSIGDLKEDSFYVEVTENTQGLQEKETETRLSKGVHHDIIKENVILDKSFEITN